MKLTRCFIVLSGILIFFGADGHPQIDLRQQSIQQGPVQGKPLPQLGTDLPVKISERQEKARNEERQKRLKTDTDKLLALATQLHDDVAKTDKNVLSLDVIRRADEIEKLAHSVKDRMRG